jgi:hypothetical protein
MLAPEDRDRWALFVENREAVIEALRQGQCEAILPAARTFLDGFATFLVEHGIVELFGMLADPRQRRSIPAFFFCTTLLHLPLFRLHHLIDIENVLFRSPFILRTLGFNARQIAQGFYASDGPRPFTAEALGDFFEAVSAKDLLDLQLAIIRRLRQQFPKLFEQATYAMDCFLVTCPSGARNLAAVRLKYCVLSLRLGGRALPLLTTCGPDTGDESGDVTRGRELVATLREVLDKNEIGLLLIDRGFIDGAWVAEQARLGTEVLIGQKSNMAAYQDLIGLAEMRDTVWEEVAAPKNHRIPPPKREVTLFSEITTWESCQVPLSGLVIRDRYPASPEAKEDREGEDREGKEEWQVYVSTKSYAKPGDFYERQRLRWEEEETFMALSRYWGANDLPPLREGVARAMIHFALLAYLLLGLFRFLESEQEGTSNPFLPPLMVPEVELAVYAGKYYALLTASELLTIVFDNLPVWQKHSRKILASLRFAERRLDSS